MPHGRFIRERAHLGEGSIRSFREALDPALPRVAAGCYTVWNEDGLYLYAGMAGRSLTSAMIATARREPRARVRGLRERLNSHRMGRRSGDQFSVYVFDRLVLGRLSGDDVSEAVAGRRQLDDDVRDFIRSHLSYRWVETESGEAAFALEKALVTEGIGGSLPYLNPRRPQHD